MAIRGGARGAAVLVGALAAVIGCSAAPASGSYSPASSSISGFVRGSNGYQLQVTASDGQYSIGASKGGAASTYTGKGDLTAEGFEADFDHFGSASVAFQPRGKPEEFEFPGCVGGPVTITGGTLVGSIHFNGEHGYTSVAATSAEASRFDIPRLKCKQDLKPPRHSHVKRGPTAPGLSVVCEGVAFSALRTRATSGQNSRILKQPPVVFTAELSERVGPIGIHRVAVASGRHGSLAFGPGLETALVRPPAPFSGMARWAADPERWSGSLRAAFPGKTVRLTGGRLRADRIDVELEKGGYGYAVHTTCADGR